MNKSLVIAGAGSLVLGGLLGFGLGRWTAPAAETAPKAARPAPEKEFTAKVVRVGDGDTIEVAPLDPPGADEKIRLLGIDAPPKGRKGYTEATAALSTLVGNKSVRIEFDHPGGPGSRDVYERVNGYVLVDGVNANVEMVRKGWAAFSDKHPGTRYAAEFRAAEDEAKTAKRGIWK